MEASVQYTCKACNSGISGQMVSINPRFGPKTHFHPGCHKCTACGLQIKPGARYTVEKDGPKCHGCWEKWHATVSTLPQGGGGKPSGEQGYVWDQVRLLEANNPKPAPESSPRHGGKGGVRDGEMGTCAACRKPIFGQLVLEGSRELHPECHICRRCRRVFGTGETFVRDGAGHPVCNDCQHKDAEKKQAMRPPVEQEVTAGAVVSLGQCGVCSKQVTGKAATVNNGVVHPECFACGKCAKKLGKGDGFVREDDGSFLCEDCC